MFVQKRRVIYFLYSYSFILFLVLYKQQVLISLNIVFTILLVFYYYNNNISIFKYVYYIISTNTATQNVIKPFCKQHKTRFIVPIKQIIF